MEDKILDILRKVLELDVDANCSQDNCDTWDSMKQLDLVVELESEFDISLEPEEIGEMKSFRDIVSLVEKKSK